MKTPYNLDNRLFSERAAAHAQKYAYPAFFNTSETRIRFIKPTLEEDAQHGIDRIIEVTTNNLTRPLTFTVQERFRRPQVALYNDITFSEWLSNSNRPAELYSIKAQLFLFGRYDEKTDTMVEAVFMYTAPILQGLVSGKLPFTRIMNPQQGKYFIAVPIPVLQKQGLIVAHYKDKAAAAASLVQVA